MKSLRLAAVLLLFTSTTFAAEPPAAPKKPHTLPIPSREFKGDFDGMVERRAIRVLVPYSRTLYFNDKGRARGLTADFVSDFERSINQKYRKQLGKRPITVVIIPTTRDKLLQNVVDGLGGVSAIRAHARPVQAVRRTERLRPPDARCAGLPGVAA